ncbi:membrane protein US12B [macacine betaherpesvirus 3]|uniref:Rh194 n=1 Tax=Rhesus cytomegalovirus (strain 68-1) TaxID=47929 RepID=I3WF73_RHCM6|nr:Rh194 [macacine betaherpesvirus 3]QMS44099.1 Rh194 [synthetic construct]QQL10481.1 Rh194 [macacine betaherpesvirus 3]QQL10663.1 Rh194 [Rhesus cytomegalovirus strain 68-1.2]QQL10847.1 Rh194 [Rhesus cytomegalovirus strain 68-1_FL]
MPFAPRLQPFTVHRPPAPMIQLDLDERSSLSWLRQHLPLASVYLCLLFVIAVCICSYGAFKSQFHCMVFNTEICRMEPAFILIIVPVLLMFVWNMFDHRQDDMIHMGNGLLYIVVFACIGFTLISFCTDGITAGLSLLFTATFFLTCSGLALWSSRPLPSKCRYVATLVSTFLLLLFYFGQLSHSVMRNGLSIILHGSMGIIIWENIYITKFNLTMKHVVSACIVYVDILIVMYYMYVYLLTPSLWTLDPHKMLTGVSQLWNGSFNRTFCSPSSVYG